MRNDFQWMEGLVAGQASLDEAIRQLNSKFPGVANFSAWQEAVFMAQPKYRSDAPALADHQSYVAHYWLKLAEEGCLDARMDRARGLIVEEKLGDDSARTAPSSDVIRSQIRKLFFNMLNVRPDDRILQLYDFAQAFEAETNRSLGQHQRQLKEAIKELSEKSYIQHRTTSAAGMELFCKGIDFETWKYEMTTKRSQPSPRGDTFNFNAAVGAVQTGDHSVAHVQQSVEKIQFSGLKTALEAVLVELAKANISPDDREDAKELVRLTIAEVEKEKPNKLSLKSLVAGVGTTIQTLGSTSEAYTVLKAAAIVVGIALP